MDVQAPDSISLEELLQGLEDAPQVESKDGFLDVEGWGKIWKITEKQASRAIAKLVKADRMLCRKIPEHTITGGMYWKPVYGIKRTDDENQS